jgi:hypothetical protein
MVNKSASPIFILGSQRSGTTLLRLMLNAHSQIAIPEEGSFWMPLLRDYKKGKAKTINKAKLQRYIDYIESNPQFSLWNLDATVLFEVLRKQATLTLRELMYETYSAFARANAKQIWGDKTPSFFRMIPVLIDLFPEARIIHLVRDGRDIYLSRRNQNPAMRNVSVQALEWVYKARKARQDLSIFEPSQVLELKYEDLVHSPIEKLQELCIFLSVPYEPEMLEYWKTSNQFIGAHHSRLVFQPVSAESVSKWKKFLTKKEIRKFEFIAGSVLTYYGYELSGDAGRTFENVFAVALQLAYGLPKRAMQVFLNALNYHLSARYGLQIFKPNVGALPDKALLRNAESDNSKLLIK